MGSLACPISVPCSCHAVRVAQSKTNLAKLNVVGFWLEQLISTSVAVSTREEAPRGKGLGHRVALTLHSGIPSNHHQHQGVSLIPVSLMA